MSQSELSKKFADFTDAIAENIGVPVKDRYSHIMFGMRIYCCQFGDYGNIQMDNVALQGVTMDMVEHYASKLVNVHVDAKGNQETE